MRITDLSLCLAASLAAWIVFAQPAAAAGTVVGQVVRLEGGAVLERGAIQQPLTVGRELYAEDRVWTRVGGKVRIELADRSVLTIGPDTEVVLADYAVSQTAVDGVLSLVIGIVRMALGASAERRKVEVRTRAAIASVRSTDWITEALADGHAAVFVVSGQVKVDPTAGGAGVVLDPGLGTDVDPGALPTAPKVWGEKRKARALRLTELN
ncbi:MAG: FecR family protein [Alphaproteobacteria bacterium]|nr:FecR family protein [Alphaproteobacteria bacterium]